MKHRLLTLLSCLFLPCMGAAGQQFALSTNLGAFAEGQPRLNVEASYGFDRHFSASAGARYNPFTSERERVFNVGARWWPWHVYSGWWMAGKAQWQEFSLSSGTLEEGDRLGAALSAGYSRMLGKHFNLDVGLGFWGGYQRALVYACGICGQLQGTSDGFFVMPDELVVALTYVF